VNISIFGYLRAFVFFALTGLLSGCVAVGGGYYDSGDIGAAYYDEPYGVTYDNWGPGYHVAPYRGGDHREHRPTSEGSHASARAFRSAPASHSAPSIPSQPRSGGARSSGSHSGGSRSGGTQLR
jgi:hypothetical protein